MPRARTVGLTIAAVTAILLAAAAWRLAPIWTGASLPDGATRLQITTHGPNLSFGCAAALLSPARVETANDELVLVSVESGDTMRVVWPSGYAAWSVGGQAVVADPWGAVVGREGDVLDSLGGGAGEDGAFVICPFGIVHADD
jgi:hypothetical protein